MPLTREQKKDAAVDRIGAIQSFLDALKLMSRSIEDNRTMCAFGLIIENAEASRREMSELFDELMEEAR